MHLKQLKLAGFKSFVDSTIIPFPSQLVAVVGPNGCGKSNIIDAVRWVMGESSAKNLRGESMVDVIFNGSSDRKSIGMASVELLFDNSLGRMGGQWANYQEIAVGRVVTRDGESSYFLNGTRCRRRDITDIFLGTGAGARGYSIIGQGTISHLVEARPEELRAFLEEAAGISKYKERRRETLARMEQTQENLVRLNDLREELGKQLLRLERQARAAKRYQQLKEEERLCKAQILTLKWQLLQEEEQAIERTIRKLGLDIEQEKTALTEAKLRHMQHKEALHQHNDWLAKRQTRFYQLARDIAVIEETIAQHQQEKYRLEADEQAVCFEWQALKDQLQKDKETLHQRKKALQALNHELTEQNSVLTQKQDIFNEQTVQQSVRQADWDALQVALTQALREKQKEELHHQHLQKTYQQQQNRLAILSEEEAMNAQKIQDNSLFSPLEKGGMWQKDVEKLQQECLRLQHLERDYREQRVRIEADLHQTQDTFQSIKAEEAALLAKLDSLLDANYLLDQSKRKEFSYLIDNLQVEEQWQAAIEFVLGRFIKALLIESMDSFWANEAMHANPVVTPRPSSLAHTPHSYPRLVDKIKGVLPRCFPDLSTIFAANDLQEARAWLPLLCQEDSILTQDGWWLGVGWVQKMTSTTTEEGVLVNQQRAMLLQQRADKIGQDIQTLSSARDTFQGLIQDTNTALLTTQAELTNAREAFYVHTQQLEKWQQEKQQCLKEQKRLQEERQDCQEQLESQALLLMKSHESLEIAIRNCLESEEKQAQLHAERATWHMVYSASKEALDKAKEVVHQLRLQKEREEVYCQQGQSQLTRDEQSLERLDEKRASVAARRVALQEPDTTRASQLQEKLTEYSELEKEINTLREQLNDLNQAQEQAEKDNQQADKRSNDLKEKQQEQQLCRQTLIVQHANLLTQFEALQTTLEASLAILPQDAKLEESERALLEMHHAIKQLGPVNLVAIDEFNEESKRNDYLHAQYTDLIEALSLLKTAITQMDNETRERLQQTFNEVNEQFQQLFPRLFGGGHAKLLLTCDNLLDAGIIVMAQPPGKRNSTIHLLSGGEKAMTAVALVFAIFQLNPSPFCMLDEIDAPLDEANIARFCALVKDMSPLVQFLIITHNKMTMELADSLIGVTMGEPGVSRIVSVNVKDVINASVGEDRNRTTIV